MIDVTIPGYGHLKLKYLVMDYNGTIAIDGRLIPGVAERLTNIRRILDIHVVTADTFGLAHAQLSSLPVNLNILKSGDQATQKLSYVTRLGSVFTVAIGNGRNDRYMLNHAKLGIALIQQEGSFWKTMSNADIVMTDINSALDLFTNQKRLIATLRS